MSDDKKDDFVKFNFPVVRTDYRGKKLRDDAKDFEALDAIASKDGSCLYTNGASMCNKDRKSDSILCEKHTEEVEEMIRNGVTRCMRHFCYGPRANHPQKGTETVLCEYHLQEVLSGERSAPPLMPYIQPRSYPSGALFYMDYMYNQKNGKK